jgi:hypothetical protein
VAKLLTQLEIKEISIVPFGANNEKFLLVKEQQNLDSQNKNPFWLKKETSNKEVDVMATAEEIKKEFDDKLRIEKEKFEADKLKLEKEKAGMVAEKEALSKQLEEQKKTAEEKETMAKEALKLAKEERDARILKEHVDYAKESLGTLGDSKEIGQLMKSAQEKLDPKEFEIMKKVFVGADEKIRKGDLFKEAGTDNHQSTDGNVIEKINKMATEVMAKEHCNYGDAISKIFATDAKLFDEYVKAGGQ